MKKHKHVPVVPPAHEIEIRIPRTNMLNIAETHAYEPGQTVVLDTEADFSFLDRRTIFLRCEEQESCQRGATCPGNGHCRLVSEPISVRIHPDDLSMQFLSVRIIVNP